MIGFWKSGLTLTAIALMIVAFTAAQSHNRAELGGRVADERGGVLPGVSLIVRHAGTGHQHTTISGETGDFLFPFLPTGQYIVTAELPGFSRLKIEGVRLSVNQRVELPLVLKIGASDMEITVTAEANRIETTHPSLKYLVVEKELKDMPIFTGLTNRSVLETLTLLVPGASSFANDHGARAGSAVSINGAPIGANGFYFEGINNNYLNSFTGGFAATPGPNADMLDEFSVLTHTFKAEAGGHPTLIQLKTKGGGNELHGQARAIHLNPDLRARDFFDTGKKSLWTTSGFGLQLSGPVFLPGLYRGRNKTFFLFDLETIRSRFESPARAAVLSDSEREGDFSGLAENSRPMDPLTGKPFIGGRVPSHRVAPQARFFIDQLIRRPTTGGEWAGTSVQTPGGTQLTTRIDHQFSPTDTVNASWFYTDSWWDAPAYWTGIEGTIYQFPNRGQNLAINYTHSFSSQAVNAFIFGRSFTRDKFISEGKFREADLTQHGYNIRRQTAGPAGFPILSLWGTNWFDPGGWGFIFDNSVWSWRDDFALVKGTHALKVGTEIRWLRGTNFNNFSTPTFSFFDFSPFGTGNEVADLLLGLPLDYSQGTDGESYPRRLISAFYIQDDLKLRSNLMLNLGLRYELNGVWSDRDGRSALFRPETKSGIYGKAPRGILFPGDRDPLTGKILGRGLNPPDHNNFAPRIGIAYSPGAKEGPAARIFGGPGRTSFRAGYGIFYILSRGNATTFLDSVPPWFVFLYRDPLALNAANGTLADPWGKDPNPFPIPLAERPFHLPLELVPFVEPSLREPYQHQWTLSIQRQLPKHVTVEAAYVGNRGVHLHRKFEGNPGLLTSRANLSNARSRRRYADFGSVLGYSNDGASSYHALQLIVSRRFAPDFQLNAHYVWSKALDDNGGDGRNMWDMADRDATPWSRANFDRRHQFVLYSVWELPALQRWRIVKHLLSGWQATGIVQIRSGIPLNIRNQFDSTLQGITSGFPDITGPFHKLDPRQLQTFKLPSGRTVTGNFLFDPTIFRTVAPRNASEARPGNLGRNVFTGAGVNNVDLSLLKRISLGERHRLDVRMDVTNLFNHAQFTAPPAGIRGLFSNSPFFGRTTGTTGPRRIQFILRYSF